MTALRVAFIYAFAALLFLPSLKAEAKGNIHTGSPEYVSSALEEFNVGVYTEATEGDRLGEFELIISFDPAYLTCIEEDGENTSGEIRIKEDSFDALRYKSMLTFKSLVGGETKIEVKEATLKSPDGEKLETDSLPSIPIHINAPQLTPPDYMSVNGVRIEGFNSKDTEYKVNIPYVEKLFIYVPEDYKVSYDDSLSEGKNTVKALVTKEGFSTLEYTLEVNMEAKPTEEPVVQEEETKGTTDTEPEIDPEMREIKEALKKSNEKKKNPEIEALNLKGMIAPSNSNQVEVKNENSKNIIILLGLIGLSIIIFLAKLLSSVVINGDHGVRRERGLNLKNRLSSKRKSDMFSFAEIESKKSASSKYFEYGLDVKINDVFDKEGKENVGKK